MKYLQQLAAVTVIVLFTPVASADNLVHQRHTHKHNPAHSVVTSDPSRFTTNRASDVALPLPTEEDAFVFAVFGDRTGGPDEGVNVLADAVRDVNLIEPDLVMTVGDLIQGYNQTGQWMKQMREYKKIMGELLCPWFPVAGNHDIYWRGSKRPQGEHEASYEMHFGPLWYAFEHKNSWFIVLYSDEGNPRTGEKSISKPGSQRMSPEQLAWLDQTLTKAADADHVFLFLHHPRWLGGNRYGNGWEVVHKRLVKAGNVTAVFAGHIHRMRSDPRDGIEYVTLATVGGHNGMDIPEAGNLHHYHLVTVRKNQVALAGIPVGETMNVREISGEMTNEISRQANTAPEISGELLLGEDGAVNSVVKLTIKNTTGRPLEANVAIGSRDNRWWGAPDHAHATIKPRGVWQGEFRVRRLHNSLDSAFWPAYAHVDIDYLAPTFRYTIPKKRYELPIDTSAIEIPRAEENMVLALDGDGDVLVVPNEMVPLHDGPFTLETWFKARSYGSRVGLITKTQSSEYGFFVNDGIPRFSLHLDGKYTEPIAVGPGLIPIGKWHHIAGVFDGEEIRLYVNGKLAGREAASGSRTQRDLALMIGADVGNNDTANSFFDGEIDNVRLSRVARYSGDSFEPATEFTSDADTVFLTGMQRALGLWVYNEAVPSSAATLRGDAKVTLSPRSN